MSGFIVLFLVVKDHLSRLPPHLADGHSSYPIGGRHTVHLISSDAFAQPSGLERCPLVSLFNRRISTLGLSVDDSKGVITSCGPDSTGARHECVEHPYPSSPWASSPLAGLFPSNTWPRVTGDTPVTERPTIRRKARVIMTNPDMLHCSLLPNHSLWAPFLRKLQFIVIDEAHHYRYPPPPPPPSPFLRTAALIIWHRGSASVSPEPIYPMLRMRTAALSSDSNLNTSQRFKPTRFPIR